MLGWPGSQAQDGCAMRRHLVFRKWISDWTRTMDHLVAA
jgi:hypothetical protein